MDEKKVKYVTVSLPVGITDAIDRLIEELGYWPSRGAFVREACLEKIWNERKRLRDLREVNEETGKSKQGDKPHRKNSHAVGSEGSSSSDFSDA